MSDVLGEKELRAVLNELGPRIERKVTRGAMSDAAAPIVKAARGNARARKKTGNLAKSAGKRVKSYAKDGVVYVAAGYLYTKGGFHGHLVEFGHRIAKGGTLKLIPQEVPITRRKEANRSKVTGEKGKGQSIGRVPGYPVLAPAFRSAASEAQRIVFERHSARVEKEAAKLAAEKGAV
jgi:hypothetical protein